MTTPAKETVFVREHDRVRHYTTDDDWITMTLLGALSADPRDLDELQRAWLRYCRDITLDELFESDESIDTPDNPWLIIDLAQQRIVAGGGSTLPENGAAYQRDSGKWNRGIPLVWMNYPPYWEVVETAEWKQAWVPLSEPVEPLDARAILFGRPLARGLAFRTLDIARGERLPAQRICWNDLPWDRAPSDLEKKLAARWHELTVRVHADWLMTPREDLGGETPRVFLHQHRDWIQREIENRQSQWSNERTAPPPLDRETFAYRHGPIGLHEVVVYFTLCRELIGFAWDRILKSPEVDENDLSSLLEAHLQWWLAKGKIDDDPTPPALIIENERRRMPLVSDGSHLDCDCPLCRMEADGSMGPMFTGFDGHHLELDDEFAFSLCDDQDEWEWQQESFREAPIADNDPAETSNVETSDESDRVWKRSFVSQDALRNADSIVAVMALAARLAELVDDLKAAKADRRQIESLNRAFDDYRSADRDPLLSRAATASLVEVLEEIATAQPHLVPKVADLQSQLDERRRLRAEQT